MIRLRELIGDDSKLPDNFLTFVQSLPAASEVKLQDLDQLWNRLLAEGKGEEPTQETWLTARDELYKAKTGKTYSETQLSAALLNQIDALWRDLSAQFERAVLDGNADWFERQAKAIRSGDTRDKTKKARGRFEAEVARVLEMSSHRKRAEEEKENPNMEAMTLEPAGKQTGVTAQQVLDRLSNSSPSSTADSNVAS